MSTNLRKKLSNFQKTRKKKILGRFWAKIGQRKLGQIFARSGEIPSPGQTSMDKTNDCAVKSERGALVRGSDPPSGRSVHKTTGDRWRAPARRMIQTIWALLCTKTGNKISHASPMAKNRPFFRCWRRA